MQLLNQLKEQGFTVRVNHMRAFELPGTGKFWGSRFEHPAIPPLAKGGSTIVTLYDDKGQYVKQATASCSEKDHYNKSRGLMIAAGRLICELSGEAQRRRERRAEN